MESKTANPVPQPFKGDVILGLDGADFGYSGKGETNVQLL
jgi:hypothetical protein